MEEKENFGKFIREKRNEIGLTQKEMATKLFVTESAVSKWERGLSYPDITLVRALCEVLKITEHELLTASEDTRTRRSEMLAARNAKIIKRYKQIQGILYGGVILICFCFNIIFEHRLSWFAVVLTSILMLTSLTLLPVVATKNRGILILASFSVSLLLLLLSCSQYASVDNWFVKIALPIAVSWLLLLWGVFIILKYTKIAILFKIGACFAYVGLMYSVSDWITSISIKKQTVALSDFFDFRGWYSSMIDNPINSTLFKGMVIFAVVFAIWGIIVEIRKMLSRSKDN